MKILEEYKVREMAGEHVVVMPGRFGADMTRVVALNPSSLYLWESLIDKDFTEDDVVRLLVEHYDVDEATARQDAARWIARLVECEILVR